MGNDVSRFGKYTTLRRIGAGGMAEIFKCRLTGIGGFDKTVVVKRILPELLDDAEFVRMFLDEARIAANLSHPNIVQIYEIDQIDNVPYIAMEYVRGPTLAKLIRESQKQGKPCTEVVARVMADVASALQAAHNARDANGQPLNIIHRDVSPHNIIVSTDGVPKLVDFGVAKARGRLSKTNAGTVKGKLRYMAPEQFRGKNAPIDHRVDIFSAGVCLYQVATGKMPYNGESEVDVLKAAATGEFALPSDVNPDMDPELERIILWAMAPQVGDRCPDAQALHEALDQYTLNGPNRVTTYHVKKHIRALFGDLDNSDVLGVGAYSGEPVSSSRYSAADVGGFTPAPPSAAALAASKSIAKSVSKELEPVSLKSIDVDLVDNGGGGKRRVFLGVAIAAAAAIGFWALRKPAPDQSPLAPTTATARPGQGASAEAKDANVSATAYINESERLLKAGRLRMAQDFAGRAKALPHLSADLHIRLTHLADALEQEQQVTDARRALQADDLKKAKEHAKAALRLNPNHAEATKILANLADKQKARTPPPAPSRRNEAGYISVVTDPPAQVFIDDEPRGTAPLGRRSLPAGTHSIEVSARGYVTVARNVKIVAGKEAKVSFRLVQEHEDPRTTRAIAQLTATPPQQPVMVASRQTEPTASDTPMDTPEPAPPPTSVLPPPPTPAAAEPPPPRAVTPTATAAQAPPSSAAADGDSPIESCPEGAKLMGAAPPRGTELFCSLSGNQRHGKYMRWYANGQKAEVGEYRQGRKNGRWIEYYEGGGERDRSEWRRGVKGW
ncbi:MAG: protein kinase domain-containing protein [Myxococcaceae bacterium]